MARLPFVATGSAPADFDRWQSRWSGLKRPLVGLLIGGNTYPYRLTRKALGDIVSQAKALDEAGTTIVVTSPRTGTAVATMLSGLVRPPHELHLWSAQGPSPYRSLLASADRFVVTEDSVSMLAEALETARPVSVAFLPRWPLPSWSTANGTARQLSRLGILTPPRNVRRMAATAIVGGQAAALATAAPAVLASPRYQEWMRFWREPGLFLEQSADYHWNRQRHESPMKNIVFVHTNDKQIIGAIVSVAFAQAKFRQPGRLRRRDHSREDYPFFTRVRRTAFSARRKQAAVDQ